MLHTDFIKHLETICSRVEGKPVKLRAYETVYGGDINRTYRLAMSERDYFIKINSAAKHDMFETEAKGLQLLAQTNSFIIPEVYETGIFGDNSFLLLSYIESLLQGDNPENFAQNLVKLHQTTQKNYGLDFDNFIGRLPQQNTLNPDWIVFYIQNRLQFQIDLAGDKIPVKVRHKFDSLYQLLPDLLPTDQPALLHGDLWSGNYFYNLQGQAVIFDPAIYYGHREIDLAMMQLFGGFSPKIFQVYNDLFPMETDWKNRLKIYQLYPLLVHVNLFGTSYLSSVNQILDYFVKK